MKKNILIGCGPMAREYYKVLKSFDVTIDVIGRGKTSADQFESETGHAVKSLDIDAYCENESTTADTAIISVTVENLAAISIKLLNAGMKKILIEKPGALYPGELMEVKETVIKNNTCQQVYIAYNRRFYSSVLKAKEIIEADGGIKSCFFDFTEWGHQIETLAMKDEVKQNWFLANSSHVVDLVFHMIGSPEKLNCEVQGSLVWHKSAARFVGSGFSQQGIPFSYHANWAAPGRWNIEILTAKHKLFFSPMEKLRIMKLGSVAIEEVAIDEPSDNLYKPGLYKQVEAFLSGENSVLCTLDEQLGNWPFYQSMANYL
jgi:predicted dehydrogenase